MISKISETTALSSDVYQRGFEEALQELERYEKIKNRLLTIRANKRLRDGETFISELVL